MLFMRFSAFAKIRLIIIEIHMKRHKTNQKPIKMNKLHTNCVNKCILKPDATKIEQIYVEQPTRKSIDIFIAAGC